MPRRVGAIVFISVLTVAFGACRTTRPPSAAAGHTLKPTYHPVAQGDAPDGRPAAEGQPVVQQQGAASTTSATVAPAQHGLAAATTTSTAPTGGGTAPAGSPSLAASASIADPAGDVTPTPIDPAPAYADLRGAQLNRTASGFELRIKLNGTPPPGTDSSHTMNIASFYDVNGDGQPDDEVWINLADTGWGGAWFDDADGHNFFGKDSGVTVTPQGDEVLVRFGADHIANAERFRWSLASEWGSYTVISTPGAARDDAPDNDQPASYPG